MGYFIFFYNIDFYLKIFYNTIYFHLKIFYKNNCYFKLIYRVSTNKKIYKNKPLSLSK